MSHCAPEATLKPKRFEFTLKTTGKKLQNVAIGCDRPNTPTGAQSGNSTIPKLTEQPQSISGHITFCTEIVTGSNL